MAGFVGTTPHGIRIAAVYTPPPLRGRGYASAIVADLSQKMLNAGRRFCFLFTDLANPVSNKIYQRLGYKPVGDWTKQFFE
jgi:predicted GNAT family acetyltransferase